MTASSWCWQAALISRGSRSRVDGWVQRYGVTVSTLLLISRSRASWTSSVNPCSWMATRRPVNPASTMASTMEAVVSSTLVWASTRPAARTAPWALGPRAKIRASSSTVGQLRAQPGGVGDLEPAPHPVAGGDQHDLRPGPDQLAGVDDQCPVLLVRGDGQRGGVQHLGAAALQGGDQVGGPAVGGDPDPEASEHLYRHPAGPRPWCARPWLRRAYLRSREPRGEGLDHLGGRRRRGRRESDHLPDHHHRG